MQTDNLHILLADDDEDDRLFFRDAVEKVQKRTKITFMNDGVQLMDYLEKNGGSLPQVVFLDLNMPKKNGIECLREIRSHSLLDDLSVAIYSTSSSEEDIEETFAQGANIYIKKPRDFAKLKKIMAEVLSLNWKYHTTGRSRENYLLMV
ncbi:MAG: response regulator [Methanococcaceae archaeon]